ncbi:MAG: hypothetical protein ACXADS_07090 [Candidatus Thorarchaeota archaeon]
MDLESEVLIVPFTASRSLQLAGGPPMEQAVPEDFALAVMVLRALEERNGNDLEFVLKAYFPVLVVESSVPNHHFLIELLGIASSEITPMLDRGISSMVERIGSSKESDELVTCIRDARGLVTSTPGTDKVTILGLMSGSLATGMAETMGRPTRSYIEPYAVILPEVLSKKKAVEFSKTLQESSRVSTAADRLLSDLQDSVHSRVRNIIESSQAEVSDSVERLQKRIDVLRKEVETLDFRLEQKRGDEASNLKSTRDARLSALKRDETRLKSLLEHTEGVSGELHEHQAQLTADIEKVRAELGEQRRSLDEILVPARGVEIDSETAFLLVPFVIAGFSKKGRLKISVYPPSRLMEEPQRVGRRREFVDVLKPTSEAMDTIAGILSKRANRDVDLRKTIRSLSKKHSLLAARSARKLVREGVKSLVSDGFAKESVLEDVEILLSGTPEHALKVKHRIPARMVAAKDGLCQVRFHIHDDSGNPIEAALVELGVFRAEADSKGVVKASLPRSSYEGSVSASGFREKTLEFTLRSADDVVIPVVLSPLSKEEYLDKELDGLLERAERIEQIRERLWEAFEKQGATLLTIPVYRSALVELLSELGYEPEAWITQAKKKRGMVKGLLKRDDRTEGVRRDILRLAEDSKQAGGIMLFSELLVRLDDMGWATNPDEIQQILSSMSKEGLVQGTTKLESGALLVQFVPVSLTSDPQQILSLAAAGDGKITIEDAVVHLGWTEERVNIALDLLVENGVAKTQKSYSKSTQYWFPGLRGKK